MDKGTKCANYKVFNIGRFCLIKDKGCYGMVMAKEHLKLGRTSKI